MKKWSLDLGKMGSICGEQREKREERRRSWCDGCGTEGMVMVIVLMK